MLASRVGNFFAMLSDDLIKNSVKLSSIKSILMATNRTWYHHQVATSDGDFYSVHKCRISGRSCWEIKHRLNRKFFEKIPILFSLLLPLNHKNIVSWFIYKHIKNSFFFETHTRRLWALYWFPFRHHIATL